MTYDELRFWERVTATLIGTLAGFVFSIALFYLTEKVKRQRDRTKILKGLNRELSFNLRLMDSWLRQIEQVRPQIGVGDQNVFLILDYTRVLRIFINEAAKGGILYDLLTDDELVGLDKTLRTCDFPAENDFFQKLTQWKAGTLTNADMFQAVEFHRRMIENFRTSLQPIATKVAARS